MGIMKPKAALVKDGFLPAGSENKRGRISKEADARCKELAASGWAIDGYSVSKSTDSTETVVKVKSDPNAVAEIPNATRDEKTLEAFYGTVKVGMRTVCNNCRQSLTYCPCPQPRVWNFNGDDEVVVHFKSTR